MAPASTSSMILHDVRLASYGSTSTVKPSKGKAKAAASSTPYFPLSASTHPHLTPEALATAGFFYDPGPDESSLDTCKCFLCGLKLGGWDEEDDPFEEHVKRGNCAWADFVCLPLITRRKGESHEFLTAASLPSSAQSTVNREATYMKQWPHKQKSGWLPTIKNLAKAGFVYNPTSDSRDSVVCPYCEYAVEGWEATDDPQAVHFNKSPGCVFFTATLDNAESSGSKPPSKPKTARRQTKAGSQRSKRNTTAVSGSQAPSEVDESMGEEIEESMAPAPRATRKGRTRGKAADEESVAEEEPEAGPSKPAKLKTTRKTKAAASPPPAVETPSEAEEEEVVVVKKTKSGKERKQTRKAQAEQETLEEKEDLGEDGDTTMKADAVEPEPASKPARKPRATRAKATTESQGAEGEEKQKKPRTATKGKKGKKVETDVEGNTVSVAESAVEEEEAEQPKSTSGRKKASSKTGVQERQGESSKSSHGGRTARTKAKPAEMDTELDAGSEATESEAEPAATEDEMESIVEPVIPKKSKKSSSSKPPSSKPSSASGSQRSKPSSQPPPPPQPLQPTASQLDMFSNIPPSSPIRPGPQHKSAPARAHLASGNTANSSHIGENTPRPKAPLVTAKPARPSPHQNLNRDTLDRSVLQGALEARKVMEDLLVNETLAPKPTPNANGKEESNGEDGEGEKRVLSESQKKMTLEDLVRMEFKSRYEEMERQGRNMISQWEQKAKESRLKIEQI